MTTELYNVDNYTDAQLYDILDMNSPTDRELEAKILHLIRKYTAMQTASGNQLATFFEDIHKRFFSEDTIEGFDNNNNVQQENIISTQSFDYSQDKLQINPLIKQTISRIISIDSQYRDVTTSPMTTNFTFDLSEPLRDVVSLKLYSVQIPYTWYTISKSYGANFFYIKATHPDLVNDPKYSYKIEIPIGNYTPNELVTAINKSFQDVSNSTASDINFNGQSLLTYNSNTSKSTFNLNIQNTFNENYYSLNFPGGVRPGSIAQYLGFNNATYQPNTVKSNQRVYQTTILNSNGEKSHQNYILDNTNNYFTVIQYLGLTPYSGFDGNQTILQQININLLDPTKNNSPFIGNASRTDIIKYIETGLQNSGYFDISSNVHQVDIINDSNPNNGYSHFEFRLIWNRNTIKYVPNAKTMLIFPNEPSIPKQNQYFSAQNPNETFSIWNYNPNATYNGFFFDSSQNQFSQMISELPYVFSTFTVDSSTNMFFTCTAPGYTGGLNDFSFNVTSGIYSTTQFVNQISQSFANNNSTVGNIFNITNTSAYIDSSELFNLTIDMTKPFTNSDYKIVLEPNSILLESNKNNDQQNYDASFSTPGIPGTSMTGNITYYTGTQAYLVDSSYILTVVPNETSNNRNAGNVDVYLPWTTGQTSETYINIEQFISNVQYAIQNTTVSLNSDDIQRPFSKSTMSYNPTKTPQGRYDISLNMQCYFYLTESSYDISFSDASPRFNQSNWYKLNINGKYSLSNQENGPYAQITGFSPVQSNLLSVIDGSNTIVITTDPNSIAPTDTIKITITPNRSYTISSLFTEINTKFNESPKTYGSKITTYIDANNNSYSQLWINVNNVYTTSDYALNFWDPFNFISCFAGASSVQNTTWDATIGWILGFRDYTQYYLTSANIVRNNNFPEITYYLTSINGNYKNNQTYQGQLVIKTIVQLTGDTTLNTNLFNYFLISLDDYIQNHLNDGLVTITRSQTQIQDPGHQYTTTKVCDPATNELVSITKAQVNSNNSTSAQLYAVNQAMQSQLPTVQQYSPGPYIKDLFGIIPVKPPSTTGATYTEFGGSLQNQSRMYFGPVNIRRMSIQLMSDRGDIVDLNGSNWTFSFVCEQLYRSSSAST